MTAIAGRLGLHMLIGFRLLGDRRGMDAGLGGKGALADIRRLGIGAAVQEVIEGARDMGERRELFSIDLGLEVIGEIGLQDESRDDRYEVGVAAALAQTVEGALDLARARQ